MSTIALTRPLAALLAAGCLAGCGSSSTLRGKVSDQAGTQQQGLGEDTGGLGGSGTVTAASSVRLMQMDAQGNLTEVASASVTASGEYEMKVPAGNRYVVQAVNAQGAIIASGMVERVPDDGSDVFAAPMDTETSVEASVLVQMVRKGAQLSQVNAVDVRARINSQVAASVKASANVTAKLEALADAVIAAQATAQESYKQSGQTITGDALFQAEAAAAAKLNAALHRGDSAQTAYATFLADLQAARGGLSLTAQTQARSESCASSSFRATINARLSTGGSPDPVADAAVRQAAALEAVISAQAVEAILRAGGAADASVTAAANAAAALRADLAASTSATASLLAYAEWQAAIQGETSMSGSVLGTYLGVNGATEITATAALTAALSASATLDGALNTAYEGTLSAAGAINFSTLATQVVSAYATYETAVRAQSAALVVFGTKASPAVDVLVVASGSYNQ